MLILAATPIGNLDDASPRLRRVLAEADRVYVEDTRQSGKLLSRLEIDRPMSSFHEHSGSDQLQRIGHQLSSGEIIVYISDAGMPGVSDPGYELVQLAYNLDVEVDVIPGPSAVINALVLSGLPTHAFCFLGFFPVKAGKQEEMVARLQQLQMTAVFFEGPSRIKRTLQFLARALPETSVAVCREMTKIHQQTLRGLPAEVLDQMDIVKGEFVLVIGPVQAQTKTGDPTTRYAELLEQGLSPTAAAKTTAKEFRISKRDLYRMVNAEKEDA